MTIWSGCVFLGFFFCRLDILVFNEVNVLQLHDIRTTGKMKRFVFSMIFRNEVGRNKEWLPNEFSNVQCSNM